MIDLTLQDGVYELTLAAEPCNEIGTRMLAALEEAVASLDPAAGRALIIHSSVRRGFSAGADLRELYEAIAVRPAEEHVPALRAFLDRIHAVMDTLDMLPMTTIGVVHGVCFGGGFELALTCDLLISERTARFCFPELRLGIIPGFGGIPRLRRDLGNALVRDLLLTGRSINARRAQQVGLCSQVVARGEGLGVARLMAAQAAKFAPDAQATAKRFMKPLPAEALAEEKEHFIRLFESPVVRDALRRFVESTDVRPYLP